MKITKYIYLLLISLLIFSCANNNEHETIISVKLIDGKTIVSIDNTTVDSIETLRYYFREFREKKCHRPNLNFKPETFVIQSDSNVNMEIIARIENELIEADQLKIKYKSL